MSRPKTPLVEDSREALTRFKMECAAEIGRTQFTKENNDHYKGDLTARQNGSEGGPIGGQMVKRMIEAYESQLKNQE
ncbi:alpha/beta-type small acid-soluble spore protein [Ruminiclostridium papyrosolvens]|uniref:Spore protein n=1 Tax=Ruminiclostridium papyrosolvens C7 TaxID=1330534 RepID=U4QXJ0_9FIRM|nr:alpha/beta-type small acid-soluble spore protein [Ruminiclostridium papyrosolvens]EPR09181.1 spore protein [Ruminiclostridium papyrosolvens C7]